MSASTTALARAREQIASARSSAVARVMDSRQQVRQATSAAEVMLGAAAAGYLDATMPDGIGGVPVGAGVGLLAFGAGVALKQPDLIATGLGFLAGQSYKYANTYGLANKAA